MNKTKTAIVLGISADIGRNIARLLLEDNYRVLGTYRGNSFEKKELAAYGNLTTIQCDITKKSDIDFLVSFVNENKFGWSLFFCSVGTSEPIVRFFDSDFNAWNNSVEINFTSQMRVLHALYPSRLKIDVVNVALLAGGGTNNPFRCYSAYCVSKIALIKMCELIDDEYEDVNIFIMGPGFVRTKTHLETLRAGESAEDNLDRVREFWESGEQGTKFEEIYQCMQWSIAAGRGVVGGRNLSIVHDPWGTDDLSEILKNNPSMFKLRRFGNGGGIKK